MRAVAVDAPSNFVECCITDLRCVLGRIYMSPNHLSRISRAILIISVVVIVLMTRPDLASTHPSSGGPQSASGVAKISEQWAKEWKAKNLDALMTLYAEDAVFMPATGSRVTGRNAIRELFEKALAVYTSDVRVHSKVTEQSGQLAYDSGEYDETSTSGGVQRSGKGNYLVILRRDNKNQWRIVEHMWTDVPATGQ